MKKVIVLLVALVGMTGANAQPCLPEGITFTTQEQIDNFQINYPGCTEIEGDVILEGWESDITNLNGLNVMTSIGGLLSIYITNLINLSGLENLNSIGNNLNIAGNDSLTSLIGLEGLTTLNGGLIIGDAGWYGGNPALTSLTGLSNLTSIEGDLTIIDNDALTSLIGLESLHTINGSLTIGGVAGNSNLTSLTGLNNLIYIGNDFVIESNFALTSIMGLDNLTSIEGGFWIRWNNALISIAGPDNLTSLGGGLEVIQNTALTSLLGLENLTSIGDNLRIGYNTSLTSLTGIDNIVAGSITNLEISFNESLSTCDIKSICDYLSAPNGIIEIYNNAPGCNSQAEVEADCLTIVEELNAGNGITIIPNPSNDKITISLPAITGNTVLSIFNVSGKKVLERQLTDNETQLDISALPRGVYFVRLQNEKMVEVGKMVKE